MCYFLEKNPTYKLHELDRLEKEKCISFVHLGLFIWKTIYQNGAFIHWINND